MPDLSPDWVAGRQAAVDELVAGLPALSATDLLSIAGTVQQMPAPRGDQPRSVLLAVRAPRHGGDVVIGTLLWEPDLLECTWKPGPIVDRPDDALDYPFRDDQPRPDHALDTGRRRS